MKSIKGFVNSIVNGSGGNLVGLIGFGQVNVHIKVERDSSLKSMSCKGSLGLVWTDLVKVVRMQNSRWSSVFRL
jgi:hypothetical protein